MPVAEKPPAGGTKGAQANRVAGEKAGSSPRAPVRGTRGQSPLPPQPRPPWSVQRPLEVESRQDHT